MGDLELSAILDKKISTSGYIYGRRWKINDVLIAADPNYRIFKLHTTSDSQKEFLISGNGGCKGKIAGNDNEIFLLENSNLYRLCYTQYTNPYSWSKYAINFKNVLAITEYEKGFACLGLIEGGQKQLKIFDTESLPNFEDSTFEELNANESKDYYLKYIEKPLKCASLLVEENSTGKIYLCSGYGKASLIHCSQSRLINAISIVSEDCLSLWFENGKVLFHYFSQVCFNNCLFLNKKVVCVEKCFCNDKCFIWSDGITLHHTEINFIKGQPKMRNFKLKKNITGVLSLIKFDNFVIAHTINEFLYELTPSLEKRKEIEKASAEIFSQIYNKSLKMKDIQKDIEILSEYMKFNEMIQKKQPNMMLSRSENFFNIKNVSGLTFKSAFWKIEITWSDGQRTYGKFQELEADLVNQMEMKIVNPLPNRRNIKVYLTGEFQTELLSFCIGYF